MFNFPQSLEPSVKIFWDKESGGVAKNSTPTEIRLELPQEFEGKRKYPNPAEVLLTAVGGCVLTTLLFFRKKLDLCLEDLQITASGTVDLLGFAGYRVTKIELDVRMTVRNDERTKAEECINLCEKYAPILRTLEKAIPIEISMKITSTNPS